MQPECAQTGAVIPCCICVLSLHQAVAGKSRKLCPGLWALLVPQAPSLLWNTGQSTQPSSPHACGYFLKRKRGLGEVLANYPLMTIWAPPAPLYPQRHPRGGRSCPGAPGGPELGAPAVRRIPAGWVSSSLCRGLGQAAVLGLTEAMWEFPRAALRFVGRRGPGSPALLSPSAGT